MIFRKLHASVGSSFYAPLDADVHKSTARVLVNIITGGCRGASKSECRNMHRLSNSAASLQVRSLKLTNPVKHSGNNMYHLF
jgi:hypothetical protein